MKKIILVSTIIAPSLIITSCGDNKESKESKNTIEHISTADQEFIAKVKIRHGIDTDKLYANLIMKLPSGVAIADLEKDYSLGNGLVPMVSAIHKFHLRSSNALYKKVDSINSNGKSIDIIEQTNPAGNMGFIGAKKNYVHNYNSNDVKIFNVNELDNSIKYIGKAKSSFPKASVILGSAEHLEIMKLAKDLKDKKIEQERIAKLKAEEEAQVAQVKQATLKKQNIESLLKSLNKPGVFEGAPSKGDLTARLELKVVSIEEKAGEKIVTLLVSSTRNGQVFEPATLQGSFNEQGNLLVSTILTGQAQGFAYPFIRDLDFRTLISPSSHVDKIVFEALPPKSRSYQQIKGNLIRK